MTFLYYFFTFVSGTFIGSFLNLVSDRSLTGEQILKGRSHCDSCKRPLGPKNLIPILSYIFQKGKCSVCGKKLPLTYPISEIATGLIFVLSAYKSLLFTDFSFYGVTYFLFLSISFSFFLILFLTDIKKMIIPDKIVIPAIYFSIFAQISLMLLSIYSLYAGLKSDPDGFGIYLIRAGFFQNRALLILRGYGVTLLSAFLIGLFFWFLVFITKGRGMGGGDIKLGFLIGIFHPFPQNILAIFLAYVIGATYSVILILNNKKTLKDVVPFGPFLIIGSMCVFLFGSQILDWYLSLMR